MQKRNNMENLLYVVVTNRDRKKKNKEHKEKKYRSHKL